MRATAGIDHMTERTDSEQQRYDQAQRRFEEGVAGHVAETEAAKPSFEDRPKPVRATTDLKAYQGEVDWVVATSLGDALTVLAKHYGSPYHEAVGITEQEAREEWEGPLDPDSPLTVWTEVGDWKFRLPEAGKVYARQWPIVSLRDQWHVIETAPLWYWIQRNGRGFLCSSEW